ncbi:MAG: glycosyltransferase [Planctomycetes bacterium]|nr:glycosyltransferase [Planctomycetota bacterium]
MVSAAVVLACLVPATAACLGYLVPTLAARVRRRTRARVPTHAFTVLVPAHNEEHALPAALRSLAALDYPAQMVRVCVVADNCTDGTAAIARAAGAECLVRCDPAERGKGYALAFGLAHALKRDSDVVLVLDADCELNPGALRALDEVFAAGADAAQAAVRSRNADDGPAGFVAAVGTEFDDATAAGWDRLGFSVSLRGTGMAFRRELLERVPWDAFGLAEDAEYGSRLKRASIRVRYCGGAEVLSEAPPSVADLCQQRRRWRAAGMLVSKPLVLAHLAVAVAAGAACGFVVWPAALVAAFALLYLRAVWAVGLTPRRFCSLLRSPVVVARLGFVTLAGVVRRGGPWERTARPAEQRAV